MSSNSEAILTQLRSEALRLRRNIWRAFHAAGSGHVGGSSSAADLLAALYFHYFPFSFLILWVLRSSEKTISSAETL